MISLNRAMAMLDAAGDKLGGGIAANAHANDALARVYGASDAEVADALRAMGSVGDAIGGAREILAALLGAGFQTEATDRAHSLAIRVHQEHKELEGRTAALLEAIKASVAAVREAYNAHQKDIADLVRAISAAKEG